MLHSIDVIILLAYLLGLLLIGFLMSRKNETGEDYFLAGRKMSWIPIALSVAATMLSANAFVGGPGWAYTDGLAPFMVNITVPLAVFFCFFFVMPVFYHLKVTSIYEYMGLRLGHFSRLLTIFQFMLNSIIQLSSMVFIPSLLIQRITGWELLPIVTGIVIISIIYTVLGGIRAVIWTDVLQTIILWGALFIAFAVALQKIDMNFLGTLGEIKAAGKFEILNFSFSLGNTNTFWASLIGGTVMWIRYFSFDQVQVQRVLTAKSIKTVKRSMLTSAILMSTMYFIMLFLGTILWVFYKGKAFDSSNEIMIGFILNELPIGVIGLVIAGAFSAAMSSVDSLLNTMTTVYIKDIQEMYFSRGKKGEATSFRTLITVSVVFGIAIIVFVLIGFSGTVRSVLDVVGKYISYFSGPACGVFILAFFTKRANDKGVALGFIGGWILCYMTAVALQTSWLYNPAIGLFYTMILGYGFSLLFAKPTQTQEEFTLKGIHRQIIASGKTTEEGISTLPFTLDKYGVITLAFFFAQYLFIILLQYT